MTMPTRGHGRGSVGDRRVALVYRSGEPPDRAWSGIPAGLARGLAEIGWSGRLVSAEPPRSVIRAAEAWALVVHRHRYGGMLAPEVRSLRRSTARRRARRARPFDGVVQMGSDFGIPFADRFVTYEDMTVRQFVRVFNLESVLGAVAVRRWLAAQAEIYDAALGCCVASRWAADSIVGDYGVERSKVHVVGIGRNYEPRLVERDWSRPRFLFVGYDWDRKNGPMLVEAFARVREAVPAARLDIVGGHPALELEGVTTHGSLDFSQPAERERVQVLFESATCFVMPSQFEPLGIAYVEAAAAGVPSIGTIVGGGSDVIGRDGGVVVDPGDADALVEAMTTMCDPVRAATMGAAARSRAHLFTWSAVAERLLAVLGLGAAPAADRT
jgi:glycosyltransferase involved in cell wall biosynthesis